MKILLVAAAALLVGCGSYQKTLEHNNTKHERTVKFNVNRLGALDTCYKYATTDSQKHGCQMLQMQLQVEQGFTVRANEAALPDTPERMAERIGSKILTTAAGIKIGKEIVDGLQRSNEVYMPDPVETPIFISVPEGGQILKVD